MKSSLINTTLLSGHISRNVPLWGLFLMAWFLGLLLPLGVLAPGHNATPEAFAAGWSAEYLASLVGCAIAAVAAVCNVFEYLFNRPAALHAGRLPVGRNTLFFTTYLAGLLPLLVIELVVFAITAAMTVLIPGIGMGYCITWLGLSAGFTFVFYNTCVFCALFSGTRTMTYYLFMLVNVFVPFAELALKQIVASVMWGVSFSELNLLWTSPLFGMGSHCIDFSNNVIWGLSSNVGWPALVCYVLASVIPVAVAVILNKRRDLEKAENTIVIPALAPVMKVLGSILVAVLAGIICQICMTSSSDISVLDAGQCSILAGVCLIGAVLGAFFVQGFLLGGGHTFKKSIPCGLVVGLLCVAFIAGCAVDVLGVKRWVPANDEVESATVTMNSESTTLSEPENIAAVTSFHKDAFAYEEYADNDAYDHTEVDLTYRLKSGDEVSRSYKIVDGSVVFASTDKAKVIDASSKNLRRLETACDSKEGIANRTASLLKADPKKLHVTIFYGTGDDEVSLEESEIVSFLAEALKPDLEKTDLGTLYTLKGNPLATIDIDLVSPNDDDYRSWYLTLDQVDGSAVAKWLKTHHGVDIASASK